MSVEELGHMGVSKILTTWILSYSFDPDRHKKDPKLMVKVTSQRTITYNIRTPDLLFEANHDSNSPIFIVIKVRHLQLTQFAISYVISL